MKCKRAEVNMCCSHVKIYNLSYTDDRTAAADWLIGLLLSKQFRFRFSVLTQPML